MRNRLTVLTLCCLIVVTGCGSDTGSDTGADEPAASGSASSEPSLPTPSSPTAPPKTPTDTFQKVRVAGTVTAVRDECVEVVDANDVAWSLVGPGTSGMAVGDQVTVTGQPLPEQRAPAGCEGAPVSVR